MGMEAYRPIGSKPESTGQSSDEGGREREGSQRKKRNQNEGGLLLGCVGMRGELQRLSWKIEERKEHHDITMTLCINNSES